jgi:hypothetical protein
VDYAQFQIAAIDLAAKGVPLTVANVVAHLHVEPGRTETFLDRMARDGRVDVEVDEAHDSVVYRVRGLSTNTGRLVPDTSFGMWRAPSVYRPPPAKSVTLAVLVAALLPGIGLVYAAPLRTVAFWTLAMVILGNLVATHMLLGPLFWTGACVFSALFGGLYAVRYNQEGQRAGLNR